MAIKPEQLYINPALTEATVRLTFGLSHGEYLELLARPREEYDEDEDEYWDE